MLKPKKSYSRRETSLFFMILYILTFLVALVIYYYLFAMYNHKCGPHKSDTKHTTDFVYELIASNPVSYWIYFALTNELLLWGLVCVFLILFLMRKHKISALMVYTITETFSFCRCM